MQLNMSSVPNSMRPFQKDWKTLETYNAKTTSEEKICRLANNLVFGAAIYGAYSYMTQPLGLVSYAAMALASRKLASTLIGYFAYPAAFTCLPFVRGKFQIYSLRQAFLLEEQDFIVRKISIYKSGVKYNAAIIGHSKTIDNGKWTIQALGNCMAIEPFLQSLALENYKNESNTLLINGPSVSESGGWPTRYQMGAGFEAGLQLLENEIKATHIVMKGLSLGGGMMAEAILNHDFKAGLERNIQYMSVSVCTFSRLSTIVMHIASKILGPILYVLDTELDGIGAARKLSDLKITHIIIQHSSKGSSGTDGVIPDNISLAHELHQEEDLQNKIFLESKDVDHVILSDDIENRLSQEINLFFAR